MTGVIRLCAPLALVAALLTAGCPPAAPPKKKPPDPLTDAMMHFRMAQSYLNAGKLHDAVGEMSIAVTKAPDHAELWNFYGQTLFLAGRYPEAEDAFGEAIERDQYLTDAHNNLGVLFDRMGKKTEAEEQ